MQENFMLESVHTLWVYTYIHKESAYFYKYRQL